MQPRSQRTIRQAVETSGIGFITGADVVIRFVPAPPNHGIAFHRTDCPGSQPIPATIEYAVPRKRRTAISHQGVTIELTEHVMAALAGLQIDNCVVELNACEPPGLDGSSLAFVEALLEAGSVEQPEPRACLAIENAVHVASDNGSAEVSARRISKPGLVIRYRLDYGPGSPIPAQEYCLQITPESFVNELAFARTFVLESEVEALRAQGYGSRTTAKDLLVFSDAGIIDNEMKAADECARHKILDCLGDFALLGCDLHGYFDARRSGHELNRDMVRAIQRSNDSKLSTSSRHVA